MKLKKVTILTGKAECGHFKVKARIEWPTAKPDEMQCETCFDTEDEALAAGEELIDQLKDPDFVSKVYTAKSGDKTLVPPRAEVH